MSTDAKTLTAGPPIDQPKPDDNDRQLWSVTTIIGAVDKPALLYWAAEQTALAAVHNSSTWQGMLADDEPDCQHNSAACAAIKWLRDARFRRPKGRRSAAELGTLVHEACESYALTGTRPEVDPEVQPFLEQFDRWLQRFTPSYQATEVTVYHPELGYAGTCDAFLTIDGARFIVDYKSTAKAIDARGKATTPYPEQVGLQLAAYRHAKYAAVWRARRTEKMRRRYYLLSGAEQARAAPVPEVDTGLVIHITPQSCEAFPIVCDEQVFDAYLAVQDVARWLWQDSRTVMSTPLEK